MSPTRISKSYDSRPSFPLSSIPLFASLFHLPSFTSEKLKLILFIKFRIKPNTCSATAFLLPSGLLSHCIPLLRAYSTSISSIPLPSLPIHLSWSARSNSRLIYFQPGCNNQPMYIADGPTILHKKTWVHKVLRNLFVWKV